MIIALALSVPSAAGLIALDYPIISVLFERGEFTNTASVKTAIALSAYAVGLPAYILTKALSPVFYARGDTATPVRIACWALLMYVILCAAFLPVIGYLGIALASGIVAWLNVIQYAWRIKKQRLHSLDDLFIRRALSIVLSSVIMGVATRACFAASLRLFPDWLHGGQALRFGLLAALIGIGGGLFAVLVLATKGVTIAQIKALRRHK